MPILDDNDSPPDVLLGPYLAATLSLTSHHAVKLSPLFTVFYLQHVSPVRLSTTPQSKPKLIVTPSISSLIPESLDSAAVDAEAIFHEAVGILRSYETYGPPDGLTKNEGLWPPLNDIEDETEHW
jgi:Rab proteins geranylgeranyltransferase component A